MRIEIKNFRGAASTKISAEPGLTVIAGANGAGKTSIAEAVRFALLKATGPVDRIKDLPELIHRGAKSGHVSVEIDDLRVKRALPSGRATPEPDLTHEALPVTTGAVTLAQLKVAERQALVSDITGRGASPQAVLEQLQSHGSEMLGRIRPYVLAGQYDRAASAAKEQAAEARGAWKAITGETYGAVKADGWAPPPAEPVDEDRAAAVQAELDALAAQGADIRARLEGQARAAGAPSVEDAEAAAGKIEAALKEGERRHDALTDRIRALESLDNPAPEAMACPDCGAELVVSDGRLVHHGGIGSVLMDEQRRELKGLRAKAGKASAWIRDQERKLAAAQAAVGYARRAAEDAVDIDEDAAREELASIAERSAALRAEQVAASERRAEAKRWQDAEARAAAAHGSVQAWTALAADVAPDGIPARLSAEAVEPVNAALADCPWPVTMDPVDFGLRLGGRPYHLLSESEQWRCDAAFAMSAARLSGARLVILDRYDVLDSQGRKDAHGWLKEATGYVLLLGTISKELAQRLGAVWVGQGIP